MVMSLPVASAVVLSLLLLWSGSSVEAQGCGCTAAGTATYRMTFTTSWTDPTPPPGYHWSWPIGTSHSACFTMWRAGSLATPGVKSMAETGSTTTVKNEFSAANDETLDTFEGGLINGDASTSDTLTADRYHPLVSVTSMIAPSPDWFVGVDSQNLCNGTSWRQSVTVDAFPWDAGTDNGMSWNSVNSVTSPPQPIARITATSPRTSVYKKTSGSTVSMGTFKFDLISVDLSANGTDPTCASACPGTSAPAPATTSSADTSAPAAVTTSIADTSAPAAVTTSSADTSAPAAATTSSADTSAPAPPTTSSADTSAPAAVTTSIADTSAPAAVTTSGADTSAPAAATTSSADTSAPAAVTTSIADTSAPATTSSAGMTTAQATTMQVTETGTSAPTSQAANTAQPSTSQGNTAQPPTSQGSTAQPSTSQGSTAQPSTSQTNTLQQSTSQTNTLQQSSSQTNSTQSASNQTMPATSAPSNTTGNTTATQPPTTPEACQCTAPGVALYRARFSPTWTDPTPPSSAHWSWPIGTSHSACFTMWRAGSLATPGVKAMAEFGSTGGASREFTAGGDDTLSTFQGSLINSASGSTSATLNADRYHPLVSVTSMIAPSPDWFVGVDSQNLCNGASWRQSVTVDAFPWDAGTDSGLSWNSGNSVTSPPQPIARITATSPRTSVYRKASGSTASMGTFTFELVSVDTTRNGSDPSCDLCAATTDPRSGQSSAQDRLLPSLSLLAASLLLPILAMLH